MALNSGMFDEVMISTDDDEIAELAKKYGAKVPFLRSEKNSDDYATTFDVIHEVLSTYKNENIFFDYGCCIYPTAPFVDNNKLKEAFNLLLKEDFDCVFPVMKFGFPIQRSVRVDENSKKIEMLYPEHLNTRSQDLEPIFHDAGQFYAFNTEKLLKEKKLWTNNTGVIKIDELEGQDIDNEVDWKLAELKFQLYKS